MKVYGVNIKIFDGEEYYNDILLFKNFDDAKQKFDEIVENYKESWEMYDTIDKTETSIQAFDKGWYDAGNLLIDVIPLDVD